MKPVKAESHDHAYYAYDTPDLYLPDANLNWVGISGGGGGGAVNSVFSRTGAVVAAASDYNASQVDNDSSVSGSFVSDALNTLNTIKQDVISGATLTSATVATGDKILGQDADDSDNLKTFTAQSIADLFDDSGSIHDDVAGEINSITEKTTPVSSDLVLIEDSADSYNKKKVQISNLPSGGGAGQLSDLSDVGLTTPTDKNVLVADGDSWESRALVEADISDLGTYLETVDLTSDVTNALPIANGGTNATDAATARSNLDVEQAISGRTIPAATVSGTDKVIIQDTDDSDNEKTVTAQSIADLASSAVSSVFSRTGAVVASASDYDASQIDNDSGVVGTYVSNALDTLDSGKANTSHSHTLADVSDSGSLAALNTVGTSQIDNDAVDNTKLDESNVYTVAGLVLTDSALDGVIAFTPRGTAPSSPTTNYVYLDDGSNRSDGLIGYRQWNGVSWDDIVDTSAISGAVTSVFSRTGTITAAASDYDASQVDNDSAVSGSYVSDALNTLNSGKANTSHTHTLTDVTDSGALAALDTVDTAQIDDAAITIPKISATGTPSSLNFLRGDGSWAVPAGGGGGSPNYDIVTHTTATYTTTSTSWVDVDATNWAISLVTGGNPIFIGFVGAALASLTTADNITYIGVSVNGTDYYGLHNWHTDTYRYMNSNFTLLIPLASGTHTIKLRFRSLGSGGLILTAMDLAELFAYEIGT